MSGSKNRICLVSDRNIPSPGFPMAVKLLEVMGWMKFRKVKNKKILK